MEQYKEPDCWIEIVLIFKQVQPNLTEKAI